MNNNTAHTVSCLPNFLLRRSVDKDRSGVRFSSCVWQMCVSTSSPVNVAGALISVHQQCCCFFINSCLKSVKIIRV